MQLGGNDVDKAFDILRNVYGSAYKKALHYVDLLLKMHSLKLDNAVEMVELLNRVNECVEQLKAILPVNFEILIPFIIIPKLDQNTRHAWERQ